MTKLSKLTIALAVLGLAGTANAAEEASSLLSNNCDEAKMTEMAGDALVSIEPGPADNIFIVTLDTDKMTFADLAAKMAQEGCF